MRTIEIIFFLQIVFRIATATGTDERYAAIDRHALSTPASATTSVSALALYLTKPFSLEEEKARAIFRWIADNISYDVKAFFAEAKSANESGDVLKSRSSVCAGYSSLFEALCVKAGLTVVTIEGYAKGFDYRAGDKFTGDPNHAWNAVKLYGEWKFVDCTWGAGKVNEGHSYVKDFEPYYFLTKPEEFIYGHFPIEKRWQLLARTISLEEFQDLPFFSPVFFRCAINTIGRHTAIFEAVGNHVLEFSVPSDVLCVANLEMNGKILDAAAFSQRTGSVYQIKMIPPSAGEYILKVYAKKQNETGTFPLAASYKVIAYTDAPRNAAFPVTFGTFIEKYVRLKSPLTKELQSGSMQEFSLIVPGAEKVAVVVGDEWDFLRKTGDQFDGTVEIGSGSVIVYAQFPGERNFQELLEYTGTGNIKRAPSPVKFKKFIDTDAELLYPIKKELHTGTKQPFRVKCPGAIKVAVVAGKAWQFLEKNGDYFEGTIAVGEGKTVVYGAYSNEKDFEGLLEYEGK